MAGGGSHCVGIEIDRNFNHELEAYCGEVAQYFTVRAPGCCVFLTPR